MQNTAHGGDASDDAPENPYFSPTLDHLEHGLGEPVPDDWVACRDCPSSIWYWTGPDELFCRCSAMHRMTWGEGEKPIRFCDGREQAIAKIIAERASQRP
jgi:hypothetical protein